jgi:hypothetical protein
MTPITDGLGIATPQTAPRERLGIALTGATPRGRSGGHPGVASGAGAVGRFGDLGRLFESRGHRWAEAVKLRQQDGKLSQLARQIDSAATNLVPIKLYPPYPPDESRRAQAIRQFNGVAAEVAKAVGPEIGAGLVPLSDRATTGEAERALDGLSRAGQAVAAARQRIAAAASSGTVPEPAVAKVSAQVGQALAQTDGATLSRGFELRIQEVL